ncbi:MAG: phosphopantetheine-binding protein [Treponema sp.]|nr:phosphopantetheine-binding protein [Treponema sp.]
MDNDIIYEKIKELLVSDFEVDPESIGLEKCLDEDLKLDSLDAVDIIISLKDYIGDKIDPALFKNARTVQDMVNLLQPLWKA